MEHFTESNALAGSAEPWGEVQEAIERLGPWFQNLHLPNNVQTAPEHPLGDFPLFKWKAIAPFLPSKLQGWRVLDIGCNAGFYCPQALQWFDRQMLALESFDVTLTFCFTPESLGVRPHYTSPPRRIEEFAEFCAAMTRRYAS